MKKFETLSKAIHFYEDEGYNLNFKLTNNGLKCMDSKQMFDPDNFSIIGSHRFDGMTSAGDESVLYVVEADEGQKKGLLVDAYGTYADSLSFKMLKKLQFARNN